jgi:hypothetical protein
MRHIFAFINYFKRQTWANIFTIYLRYLIGAAFVFASFIKMQGGRFYGSDGSTSPINSMPHFFETLYQSGLYWQFLGVSQLIAGAVLMTQRFALIGSLIFLPIIANIFVITIAYDFRGTPFITGLMLLGIIYLILWNLDRLLPLFTETPDNAMALVNHPLEKQPVWILVGVAILLTTVLFRSYGSHFMVWYAACLGEGLAGFLWFLFKKRKTAVAL